jgi:hypothetical protein
MNDKAIVVTALNQAALIIGDYLQPGLRIDADETLTRLIEVLDNPELEVAINRMKREAAGQMLGHK